ncbi:DUF4430 domain-containing protein [Allofournierella sp.]|uniref:DUF4430 domain-containing protein n=1 Tax=Allofournierella sp. TaxID=1940256 RepID=UPI003AB656BC
MKKQTKKLWLIAGVAVLVVAALVGCWLAFGPKAGPAGGKAIDVTVIYADQSSDEFHISTSSEFLRGALEEQKLIQGTESEFGLFVTTVNGVTVDDSQQQWWRFSKGGEVLMTGVDSTPIADGDAFEITLTTGY